MRARKTTWPAALVTAIRAELAGNAQRDLLGWAHRVTSANKVPADVSRARLILDIDKEGRT